MSPDQRNAFPPVSVQVADGASEGFRLLARAIRERTGINVVQVEDRADIVLQCPAEIAPEAYRIADSPRQDAVRIEAADGRGLVYGVGRLLRGSEFGTGRFEPSAWRGMSKPVNPVRAIYFASHFYNWYHVAPIAEVERYVEELALYGCNCLSVWFDLHDYASIDTPEARAMVERLRAILTAANRVGMGASLLSLANEGFTSTPDELKATNAVQNGYHGSPAGFYNTEVCPSQPGGMDLILANRKAVLEAFAGIDLDYVCIWPYDQGGCTCDRCAPWAANGLLRAAKPVAELVRRVRPETKIVLSTWYFDRFIDGEWARFDRWVKDEKPDWLDYLLIDGFCAFPEYPLQHGVPGGFPVVGFPEISMEGNSPWGGYGANPRPRHWRAYWERTKAVQIGNFPYSEGIYEDVNKFLMLQLNWAPERDVDSILHEYASGWFGAAAADTLVEVFHLMEADESTTFRLGREPVFANETGLPHAEECEEKVKALDDALPDEVRRSWRWRVTRLRARIDAQLKASGMRFNDALDADFAELARIYHADPQRTLSCVLPPRRQQGG